MFGGDGFDLFRIPNFFDAVRNRCPLNNWHGRYICAGSLKHDRYRTVLERVWPRTEERESFANNTPADISIWYLYSSLFVVCLIQEWHFTVWYTAENCPSLTWRISPLGNDSTFLLFIYLSRVRCVFCLLHQGPSCFLLFLFLRVLAPFLVYLRRPLRRHSGTGESLKRVLWWAPFALAQLPVPSVNWSFKPDTPRRHCDRSTSFLSVASYTYTRLFLFFSPSF